MRYRSGKKASCRETVVQNANMDSKISQLIPRSILVGISAPKKKIPPPKFPANTLLAPHPTRPETPPPPGVFQ